MLFIRSYKTFEKRSKSAKIKKGLITLLPFFTAKVEPKRFPAIENSAQIIAKIMKTFLYTKNVIKAAILDERLTTFAFPEAVVISKCKIVV